MLELHQFLPHFGLPNASPFCMKVEAYLRLAGIEYKSVKVTDPGKGPNGKAPWIVDQGERIPDSRIIIEYLNRKHGYPLRNDLDKQQLATHHTITRMLDESTYWGMVYERWMLKENIPLTRDTLLEFIPNPLRKLVFAVGQRSVKSALHGQGTGRLSLDEIVTLAKHDIDALSDLLGDKPYFGGDKPAEIDATTIAYIAGFITPPVTSKIRDYIRSDERLVAYHERMMKELFPEFVSATAKSNGR